jgi:hypothetical protein
MSIICLIGFCALLTNIRDAYVRFVCLIAPDISYIRSALSAHIDRIVLFNTKYTTSFFVIYFCFLNSTDDPLKQHCVSYLSVRSRRFQIRRSMHAFRIMEDSFSMHCEHSFVLYVQ